MMGNHRHQNKVCTGADFRAFWHYLREWLRLCLILMGPKSALALSFVLIA